MEARFEARAELLSVLPFSVSGPPLSVISSLSVGVLSWRK